MHSHRRSPPDFAHSHFLAPLCPSCNALHSIEFFGRRPRLPNAATQYPATNIACQSDRGLVHETGGPVGAALICMGTWTCGVWYGSMQPAHEGLWPHSRLHPHPAVGSTGLSTGCQPVPGAPVWRPVVNMVQLRLVAASAASWGPPAGACSRSQQSASLCCQPGPSKGFRYRSSAQPPAATAGHACVSGSAGATCRGVMHAVPCLLLGGGGGGGC